MLRRGWNLACAPGGGCDGGVRLRSRRPRCFLLQRYDLFEIERVRETKLMALVGNYLCKSKIDGCDFLIRLLDGQMFLIFVGFSSGILYFLVSPSCTFNI